MRYKLVLFLIIGSIAFINGCAAWVVRPPLYASSATDGSVPPFFALPSDIPPVTFPDCNNTEKKRECAFSFSSWKTSGFSGNDTVKVVLHFPNIKRDDIKACIILMPPSGENIPAEIIAKKLVSLGFPVARVKAGFNPLPKSVLGEAAEKQNARDAISFGGTFFKEAMRQRVGDSMRLINALKLQFPDHHFSAAGISLGGMVASALAVADPRVQSLFMGISSASVARVIMDSTVEDVAPLRELLLDKFNLSYEEAYQMLAEEIREVEPLTYASRLNAKKILMVSGLFDMLGIPIDSAIPLSATQETWRGFGKPEWVIINTGHVTAGAMFFPIPWPELSHPYHIAALLPLPSYMHHLLLAHYLPKIAR